MKKQSFFAAILFAASTSFLASCEAAIIVGWESWSPNGRAHTVAEGDATGLSSPVNGSTWFENNQGASNDGDFGTLPGADTDVGPASSGTFLRGGGGSGAYNFTVTAGAQNVELTSFNFDTQRERNGSAENWSVTILSGPISIEQVGTGTLNAILGANGPSDQVDIDLDLTGLVDNILEAGESATFQIAFTGGTGANNQDTHLDNVAIGGNFLIPEPASIVLIGLVASILGVAIRRKNHQTQH